MARVDATLQESKPEQDQTLAQVTELTAEGPEPEEDVPLTDVFLRSPLRLGISAVIVAAIAVVAALRYDDISHIAIVTVYGAILVVCAASDLATFRVPNVVTYPAAVMALLIAAFLPDSDLVAALIGGAVAGSLMLFALIVSRGGMGLGDVKLSTFVGLALGWPFVAPAMVLTAIAGGTVALLLLVLRVKGRKDPIPYAPFISAGAVVVMLWQGTAFIEI